MRLTIDTRHHSWWIEIGHGDQEQDEQRDSALDTLVESAPQRDLGVTPVGFGARDWPPEVDRGRYPMPGRLTVTSGWRSR